jgi:protein-tyrosine phosphatase
MIDLHCHILPGIDDGPADLSVSLEMARAMVADGVSVVACTPHILPGVYHNSGPQIRRLVAQFGQILEQECISLRLATGADNHMVPSFVASLRSGHLLTLGESRYVLVEPPHHVPPVRLEDFFFELMTAGYVPVLTHPERLSWTKSHYGAIQRMVRAGVWMQITAGSLAGDFGQSSQYWAERMLEDGNVHILATDAHDVERRLPILGKGRELAARRVGDREAEHLVETRPRKVLANEPVSNMPLPGAPALSQAAASAKADSRLDTYDRRDWRFGSGRGRRGHLRWFSDGLRGLFK